MKWATAAVLAAIVILMMAAANEAYGAGPKPPRRCHPVAYIKCWYTGHPVPPPVVHPTLPGVPRR